MEMIREQNDTIMGYESKIPKIELDILMENVRKLYEVLKQLEKLNNSMADEAHPTPPEPVVMSFINDDLSPIAETVQLIAEPEKLFISDEPSPKAETVQAFLEPEMSFTKDEPAVVEDLTQPPVVSVQPEEWLTVIETPVAAPQSEVTRDEVMPQVAIIKDAPKQSAKSATLFDDDPHTLADTFQSAPTLNDRLASSQSDQSIATKLKSNPIADLKKAIGINEKFALINELFHGDINAYNDAIEVLNNATDEAAAISYLEQTLASKYGWDTADESYLKLHNLVERRY